MRERIEKAVKNANSIDEVKVGVFAVLDQLRTEGNERIGYVAGIITSDGPENIDRNVKRLIRFTEDVRGRNTFPVFSSTDVIGDALFKRLGAALFKQTDWEKFWRDILGADEKFVTDMFMTPGWEKSRGATDEHNTAKKVGMQIHYLIEEI